MQEDEEYWRIRSLDELLEKLDLSSYSGMFAEQEIDLATFLTMTEADLTAVGVGKFGPRRRMKAGESLWVLTLLPCVACRAILASEPWISSIIAIDSLAMRQASDFLSTVYSLRKP